MSMKNMYYFLNLSLYQGLNGWVWLGASDEEKEGEWVSITGQAIDKDFPWSNRQPDNKLGREHCLGIYKSRTGRHYYTDNICARVYNILCQRPNTSTL